MPATAKQEAAQLLAQLRDDATVEDIRYHVYVLEKIQRGRADIAASRRHTTEQARERLARWLSNCRSGEADGRRLLESIDERFKWV